MGRRRSPMARSKRGLFALNAAGQCTLFRNHKLIQVSAQKVVGRLDTKLSVFLAIQNRLERSVPFYRRLKV